ncbi:MAG: hypothetical protein QOC84_584 [Bradyrhizobium sp.]|nr:hypothetical protein [Bradyrhizobium sp.]
MSSPPRGHVAEWLRNGLQNRVHQFNSGRGLHPTPLIFPVNLSRICKSGVPAFAARRPGPAPQTAPDRLSLATLGEPRWRADRLPERGADHETGSAVCPDG